MFEIAVLGPIAGSGQGVVSQCVHCRAAYGPGAAPCTGFAIGCLCAPVPSEEQAGNAKPEVKT